MAGTDAETPRERAATWLAARLEEDDGLLAYPLVNGGYDNLDLDLGMRAAEVLEEVGGHAATVELVVDAIVADLAERSGEALSPVERAAYLAFLGPRVDDPRDVAGRDLVAELEAVVDDGRLADDPRPDGGGVLPATVAGQADAVRALRSVASAEYASARSYLVAQQCPRGPFGHDLAPPGASRPCTRADESATVSAGLALAPEIGADARAGAAAVRAATWLAGRQLSDGAVESSTSAVRVTGPAARLWTAVQRRRSTPGLVGAIARGAGWVRGRQLAEVGSCRARPEKQRFVGAVRDIDYSDFYMDRSWDVDQDSLYIPGTVGALTALPDQLDDPARATPTLKRPKQRFHPIRRSPHYPPDVLVAGASAGEPLCVLGPHESWVIPVIEGGLHFQRCCATEVVTYRVTTDQRGIGTLTLRVLGPTTVRLKVRERVSVGSRQRVRVRGLESWERVTIRRRGTVVARGKADMSGHFQTSFPVRGRRGKVRLEVQGEFSYRHGSARYRVVR